MVVDIDVYVDVYVDVIVTVHMHVEARRKKGCYVPRNQYFAPRAGEEGDCEL